MTKQITENSDYKSMIDLLAVFSDATNRLQAIETQFNQDMLESIDENRAEYAKYQQAITDATAALEFIATNHPEWFAPKKSVKTPYGTIKFHKSTSLDVPNEEATILLVENWLKDNAEFKREDFIRTKDELNLEALEKLDDSVLKKLRIKRVEEDNFSVVAARIDMGKAVQKTARDEDQKAA